MYERFKLLCQIKGMTMKEACTDLSISQGTVSNWKNRGNLPTGELTIKLADYFNVTTDVILGHESEKSEKVIKMPEDSKLLLDLFKHDNDFRTFLSNSRWAEDLGLLKKDSKSSQVG